MERHEPVGGIGLCRLSQSLGSQCRSGEVRFVGAFSFLAFALAGAHLAASNFASN
jgi:hypothetical protein